MTTDTEWLRSLKTGDRCVVDTGYVYRPELGTVARVTPTGIIVVVMGGREYKFSPNGWMRGQRSGRLWRLCSLNAEAQEAFDRRRLREYNQFHNLTIEQVRAILAIIDAKPTEPSP